MRLYWIQPHELKQLMTIERPWSFGIATTALGAAIGLVPTLTDSVFALMDPSKGTMSPLRAALYAMLWAAVLVLGIATGCYAWQGRTDVRALLDEIEKRPGVPAH
jgi:hypothetical protein